MRNLIWRRVYQGQAQGSYAYDACRVPWRMSLDYLWNGNEEAKKWCTTISKWAYGIGPKNIKDGYNLNGSATGNWHSMSYTGGFAVAAMCNSQEVSDAFGKEIASMQYDNYWYHAYLGNCYMLAMTGNMWCPELDSVATKRNDCLESLRGTSVRSFSVRNIANRQLILSGIDAGHTASLVTLGGKMVSRSMPKNEATATVDISSVKKGCYILSVRDRSGIKRAGRVVTIF